MTEIKRIRVGQLLTNCYVVSKNGVAFVIDVGANAKKVKDYCDSQNLKVEGKSLILLAEKNENVQKSARNIEGVKTSLVNTINVYDLLKYKNLVITLDTVKKLEEVYA